MAGRVSFKLEPIADDGLETPVVGPWGETKYRLAGHYCHLFATGMKNRFEHRIYLDLYSGPGRVRFSPAGPAYLSTPLIALTTRDPFSRYIFGDLKEPFLRDLETRARQTSPSGDLHFLPGDANVVVHEAMKLIPRPERGNRVLTFCVLDPYDLSSLRFSTIEAISSVFVDFFVLIASGMDASRNWEHYQKPGNPTVDGFLGTRSWRDGWAKPENLVKGFGRFVVDEFIAAMAQLDFKLGMQEVVRQPRNNSPLYYLAGFSRHPRGVEFWKKAGKSADPNMQLDFGA